MSGLILLMASLAFAQAPVEKESKESYVPGREMVIELNPVEDATAFEVEITPRVENWANPFKFNIDPKAPVINVRLTPGEYLVKTRSIDKDGQGPWSEPQSFWVYYKMPDTVEPAPGSVIKPKSFISERIAFEWPRIPGATKYIFVLKDEKGQVLKRMVTDENWAHHDVELNAKYTWTVAPLSPKEDPESAASQARVDGQFLRLHGGWP